MVSELMDHLQGHAAGETVVPLTTGWLLGPPVSDVPPVNWPDDRVAEAAGRPDLDDSAFVEVTVPHTVAPLSWRQWDKASWEKVWSYRLHFDVPRDLGGRVFLDFEAVMTNATVTLNGVRLGQHHGGYLPFSFEVTDSLRESGNVLAVLVDARFNLNVPPNIPIPVPAEAVDYWQPAGIYGTVSLRGVPTAFVSEVVATPQNVLDPDSRSVRVSATVDAVGSLESGSLQVALVDTDGTEKAATTQRFSIEDGGTGDGAEVDVVLDGLGDIELWDVASPRLYHVVVSLSVDGEQVHERRTRIGFREARFERDGFYLNGRRLYLFGANRHQHYPFAGFAMPARVQRRDAQILRDLNCVMVRCSHYPQLSLPARPAGTQSHPTSGLRPTRVRR